MENLPSANMRQHKLDQQRKLIEEKQRQKRAAQNKKIELSDLKSGGGRGTRPSSSTSKRELHGYDGPLQYLSQQGNPDSMTAVQVGWAGNRYNSVSEMKAIINLQHFGIFPIVIMS